jgi:predicted RNA-binding Zn-ribbon protein involved in translation (DUF1610 family)
MEVPETVRCDKCGAESPVIIPGAGVAGEPVLLPKCTTRGNSVYVFIECPNCGEREQRLGQSGS